jgi:hypothetical protein
MMGEHVVRGREPRETLVPPVGTGESSATDNRCARETISVILGPRCQHARAIPPKVVVVFTFGCLTT